MARRSSLTNTVYGLARTSATWRAASRGPGVLGMRYVRQAIYRKSGSATPRIFRAFGF